MATLPAGVVGQPATLALPSATQHPDRRVPRAAYDDRWEVPPRQDSNWT
jgi:hypothetical protein